MIRLEKVTKIYQTKSADVSALKDVTLELGDSGLVFILGKSGCGKTTLLNVLGGLDEPTSGEVFYNGRSLKEFGGKDCDDYRNFKVGFVFQEFNLLSHCNVGANVGIALELQSEGKELRAKKINDALSTVGLADYNNRKITELSGGQKQRVAIARALVKDSQIILADEPTGNLDSSTSEEIYDVLKRISENRLVVVVSHDVESAEKYADRIIKLKDGEISSDSIINEDINLTMQNQPTTEIKKSGKLSFISMLKMSLRNFSKHWFRMVITCILFIATLSLMGSGVALMTKNPYERYVQSYQKVGDKSFTFSKYRSNVYSGQFTLEEYKNISQEFSNTVTYPMYSAEYYLIDRLSSEEKIGYYRSGINGIVVGNQQLIKQFGYEVVAGELPQSDKKEVCITKYTAESLIKNQKDYCKKYGISKIGDFVGHTLAFQEGRGSFRVCGVVDTKVSAYYDGIKNASDKEWNKYYRDSNTPYYYAFYEGVVESPHMKLFVSQYFLDNYFYGDGNFMLENNMSGKLAKDGVFDYSNLERTADISGDDEILLNAYQFSKWIDSNESQMQPDGNYYITLNLSVWHYGVEDSTVKKKLKVKGYFTDYNTPNVLSANVFDELSKLNPITISSIQVLVDSSKKNLSIYEYIQNNNREYIYNLHDEVFHDVQDVNESIEVVLEVGVYILLGVIVFTLLMMLNFILSSIKGNEKEMGILRAIGAKQSNIFLIYFIEMALLVLISWFLSIFVAVGISSVMSRQIVRSSTLVAQNCIMPINFIAVMAMLGFGLLIAFIGSAIPILVKARKKPIDLVKK